MFTDIIILAGGFGERLWPASRPDFPKQFMALDGGISFMQHSILRAVSLMPSGKIIVATRKGLEEQVSEQAKLLKSIVNPSDAEKLDRDLIVFAEPTPRHTTAPILACAYLVEKLNPNTAHNILILTSDHIIKPIEKFELSCQKAEKSAEKGAVVTFGIVPTEPSTGYGYILTGKEEGGNPGVFRIEQFAEKPNEATAKKYLESGNCSWNSGMYALKTSTLYAELKTHTPEVIESFECVKNGSLPEIKKLNEMDFVDEWKELEEAYKTVPAIAIDKSVAEKTENAWCVFADFDWDDVGSWDSFEKHCDEKTKNAKLIESENCFVYSDIPVAICGLDNISVVIKNGKALVMKKGKSALVREAAK